MKNLFKAGMAAAVGMALAQPALADTAETTGGIAIKSDDGQFEAKLGGRIHLDFASLDSDASPTYDEEGGAYFRRARLALSGKAYGWEYKFENDFADAEAATRVTCDAQVPPNCTAESIGTSSFRDLYIATSLLGGKLTIGQFKPLRGMEEMTSSNERTMIEAPFASASGIFSGRQFGTGVRFETATDTLRIGIALQNNSVLKGADSRITEEPLVSARLTLAPVNTETTTIHVGLSASIENGGLNSGARLRGRGKLPATDLGTSRTLAEAGAATAARDKDAGHLGLELGAALGPFFAQAEYIQASYSDAYDGAGGAPADAGVAAYYFMASYFVTGEHKPYKGGVFKSPKPGAGKGAVELKARYDFAGNEDQPATAANRREISALTVGANWYLNPSLRFMLEYSVGEDRTVADTPSGGNPEPRAVTLRTQFSF